MSDLQRITQFKCNDRHNSLRLQWVVKGAAGAIEFHCNLGRFGPGEVLMNQPNAVITPFGVELHHRVPADYMKRAAEDLGMYREPSQPECELLDGAPCYHDGSSLFGEEVYRDYVIGGDWEGLWAVLEDRYRQTFGEEGEKP